MRDFADQISSNLAGIRDRIAEACRRSGRSTDSVALIAVTKYAEWPWVEALLERGITQLGESRPQQLLQRADLLPKDASVDWHLIGHLQRNKVRPVLPVTSRIHSVDSLRLLKRIDLIAADIGLAPRVLLEVNVSGEDSKDGFDPALLQAQWETIQEFKNLTITGLMTMAPHDADEKTVRGVFSRLRELQSELAQNAKETIELSELSMGMSGDFEWAIEEGSTHIRIGSGLFEDC